MNLHWDYFSAAHRIALCYIPPVCGLAAQPGDEAISKHQHIKARAKCGSRGKNSYQRAHEIILLGATGCSKVSCWCGTGVGRVYPLGPCSGWALPQPREPRGLSQPGRTAPLQGCLQGTHTRLPLNPAEDFEVLPCFLFFQMTPLLFGKV